MNETETERVIRGRATRKTFLDPGLKARPETLPRETMERLVESAGWAPFHRPAKSAREGGGAPVEPWRAHLIDGDHCGLLAREMRKPEWKAGKLPMMLAAARGLVCVTWLPEEGAGAWEANDFNMEHIAAAGAAIQNMCLAATALELSAYWSSGGPLARREGLDLIGASAGERLLGAVFLFPQVVPEGAESAPGKMRALRSGPYAWSHWVDLGAL